MAEQKKNQLHALLAVEGELKGTSKSMIDETAKLFEGKPAHFQGAHRRYQPFNENERNTEGFEEHLEMVTTVREKLGYVFEHLVRLVDVMASKDSTNQVAKADILLDGHVLASDVPATTLLSLETELKQWQVMLEKIPTLAPGIKWEKDETRSRNGDTVWRRVHPDEKFKTAKSFKHKVLYDAVVKDGVGIPAQLEKWSEDVNVGKFITEQWSGMLTPAEKSALLGRLAALSRAVKAARQTANSTEVVQVSVGKKLIDYLLKF